MQIYKLLLWGLLLHAMLPLWAQNREMAVKDIEVLASPVLKGRGYTHDADLKAARYLRLRLEKMGIKPYRQSYFQEFTFSVNTFPSQMKVRLDKSNLTPGVDFLVSPQSSGYKGSPELHFLTDEILRDKDKLRNFLVSDHKNAFVVVDTFTIDWDDQKATQRDFIQSNIFKAGGIVALNSNLVHGISTKKKDYTIIYLRNGLAIDATSNLWIKIIQQFVGKYTSQNVIGYLPGKTDTTIVLTAHYDHLGQMGNKTYFPGAHDNASGVAMVLNLAEKLLENSEELHYSYAFIFFSGEELGLIGSHYYTDNPLFSLAKIKFLLNLDLIGSGDEGITVVNATVLPHQFALLQKINSEQKLLKAVKPRAPAANSDHYYFHKNGVPSFFVYTMGKYKEYHNINDRADALEMPVYDQLFELFYTFVLKI